MDKFEILKQIFGYDTFREGQEELVDSSLLGRDVAGDHADGSREIYLLPGSGSFVSGIIHCGVSIDLAYEGSGVCVKCGWRPCGLHKQFSYRRASTGKPWNWHGREDIS